MAKGGYPRARVPQPLLRVGRLLGVPVTEVTRYWSAERRSIRSGTTALAIGLFGISEILLNLEKSETIRAIRPKLRELGQTRAGYLVGSQFADEKDLNFGAFPYHAKSPRPADLSNVQFAAQALELSRPGDRRAMAETMLPAAVKRGTSHEEVADLVEGFFTPSSTDAHNREIIISDYDEEPEMLESEISKP